MEKSIVKKKDTTLAKIHYFRMIKNMKKKTTDKKDKGKY
jgi:hypothetical protein